MTSETNQPTPAPSLPVVHPLVDILESESEFLLVADLPGAAKEDLQLTVDEGKLNLAARGSGIEYRRSFALGDEVEVEAIEAQLEHGELKIRLPKRAARVRKITVTG